MILGIMAGVALSALMAPEMEFSADAANYAFTGNANFPAGEYDATGQKTWMVRQAWDGTQRVVRIQYFDHVTGRYSRFYTVGVDPLVNDGHGVPAICIDHQGYIHVFFGSHNSPTKYRVSAFPRDPTLWITQPDIGTDTTYPHPMMVGTTMYLFLRGNGARELHRYKTTALTGGVATWAAAKVIADFAGGRFYMGATIPNGTNIHIIAAYSDAADTFRRDIYEIVIDTTDDSADNSDGSVSTAVGAQPISKATADASYIVVDQTTNITSGYGFCITADGKRHLAYVDDSGTAPLDVKYKNFNAGAWSAAATVVSVSGDLAAGVGYRGELSLVNGAANAVELWFPDDPGAIWDRGGDMKRMIRDSGGAWGSVETIRVATGLGQARPSPIRNAHPDLRVMWTEEVDSELDADAGGLKTWAYGDSGMLPAYTPEFDSGPTAVNIDGLYAEGDIVHAVYEHNGQSTTYQWQRDGADIAGATAASYTLDAADVGAMIRVKVTATNFVGNKTEASPAVGPIVTPVFAVQNRTITGGANRTITGGAIRTINNRTA